MPDDALPPPTLRITRPGLGWAAIALMLAIIGWSKGINLLLLLGYFLLALLLVNAWVARRMIRNVKGRRRPGVAVFAGERVAHSVEIENASNQVAAILIVDGAAGREARWLLPDFPPGGSETLRAEWTFPARGRYPVGPLAVQSEFPLGLVCWEQAIEPPVDQLVLPSVGRVDVDDLRRWVARSSSGEGQTRRPARRQSPGLGDVRGVRPYRPGDSPRDIHWRTTARRNMLVVREYDQTDPIHLVVILDPWVPVGDASADLEWALSAAMSVGWAWAIADEPGDLTLIVPGNPPTSRTGRATPGFVRSAFAPLAGLTGMTTVPTVPTAAVRLQAARTARMVISSRPDSPILSDLRRGGVPVAAVHPKAPPGWYHVPNATLGERGA